MLEENEYEVNRELNEREDRRRNEHDDRYDDPRSEPEDLDQNGEPIPHWKQEYIDRSRAFINRLNALKSTGPKSPRGKRIVSRNALKHGLTAKRVVLEDEAAAEFKKFQSAMLADLSPVGEMEQMLAERIVSLSWRLKRAESMESATLNLLKKEQSIQHRAKTDYTPRVLPDNISALIFDAMGDNCANTFLRAANLMIEYYEMRDDQKPSPEKILGSVTIQDFSDSGVIDKLIRYQKQLESSLYKAISELHRMQLIRKSKSSAANGTQASSLR